jgi:hypothetical protein
MPGKVEVQVGLNTFAAKGAYWGLTRPDEVGWGLDEARQSHKKTLDEAAFSAPFSVQPYPRLKDEDFFGWCESLAVSYEKDRDPFPEVPPQPLAHPNVAARFYQRGF